MTLSNESREKLKTCSLTELEQIMYDIREDINCRSDVPNVIEMMVKNELDTTKFCKRKRPV